MGNKTMLGLQEIKALNEEKMRQAAEEKKEPYFVEEGEAIIVPFPFPNIGYFKPKNWKQIEIFFVDKTGLGQRGEPALTVEQFIEKIEPGFGYAIVEEGEFQVNVGKFKKVLE